MQKDIPAVTGLICPSTTGKPLRVAQGVGGATIEIWGPVQYSLADNPELLCICLRGFAGWLLSC